MEQAEYILAQRLNHTDASHKTFQLAPWLRCAVSRSFGALQLTSVCDANGDHIRSSITFYEPLTRLKLHHQWLRRRRLGSCEVSLATIYWRGFTKRCGQSRWSCYNYEPRLVERNFAALLQKFRSRELFTIATRRNNAENFATQHETHFQWARMIFFSANSIKNSLMHVFTSFCRLLWIIFSRGLSEGSRYWQLRNPHKRKVSWRVESEAVSHWEGLFFIQGRFKRFMEHDGLKSDKFYFRKQKF